ncbi:MAG: hypothetical protein Q4G23_01440 [Clostridia bacterium]|nr:hypothetical protein [Clostridia bacterium]
MKWYKTEIADMLVSVFCNGLDNLMEKTGYEFSEAEDYADSDILIIFSSKYDKSVKKVMDKLAEEGSYSSLNAAVFAFRPEEENPILDLTLVSGEKNLASALSDLLKMLDYYLYITPVDVGYELSKRGTFTYEKGTEAINFAAVKESALSFLEGIDDALMLLEAGEEIFISDIENLTYDLSDATGDTRLTIAPLRTLPGERVRFSIMHK